MNITTSAQDFAMSVAIDELARTQLRSALQLFSDDALAVDIFMKDSNGPKGGVDKQALIRIRLHNRQVIALETRHENLYAAIKRGSTRSRRVVRRQLRKSRRIQKQRMRDYLIELGPSFTEDLYPYLGDQDAGVRAALADVRSLLRDLDRAPDALPDLQPIRARRHTLLGRAAIGNVKLAYARYKDVFLGEAFAELRQAGARVQRPLWASTSAKNPRYNDTKYIDSLIGINTVNASRDHNDFSTKIRCIL